MRLSCARVKTRARGYYLIHVPQRVDIIESGVSGESSHSATMKWIDVDLVR